MSLPWRSDLQPAVTTPACANRPDATPPIILARRLLETTYLTVTEVARQARFEDDSGIPAPLHRPGRAQPDRLPARVRPTERRSTCQHGTPPRTQPRPADQDVRSSSGVWCSKAAWSDVTSATAGLMIVGLFQGSTKGEHHDGREGQDDRCPTCRQADERRARRRVA
jgi:hypothetical protein